MIQNNNKETENNHKEKQNVIKVVQNDQKHICYCFEPVKHL